jgi:hypothetical protein
LPPSIPATNEHMYMSWMRGRSEQASRSALLPRLLHAASNVVAALAVFASNVVRGRGSGCVFLTWCGAPPGGVEKKTSPGETRRSRQPCTSHCEGRVLGAPDVAVSGGEVYETSNMRCVEYVFVLGLLTCSCVALSVSPGPSSPLSLRSDRSEPRAPLCAGSSSLPCLHGDRLDFYETTSQ